MSTRARDKRRPRRIAVSREAKAPMHPPPPPPLLLPLPLLPPPPPIAPENNRAPAPLLPPSSSSNDLRWLVDLDLACYSSFAVCLLISALATRELRARLLSLAVSAGCAAFAAAAALAPRAYSRRRDLAAVLFRALFAAAINPMMSGGRRFPVGCGSWARFFAGRTVLVSTLFLGLTARLPAFLAAVLACAQTALLFRAQRPACEAVLVGYVGIGSYYVRMQAFIDEALSAGSWLVSAVEAAGGGGGAAAASAAVAAAAPSPPSSFSLLPGVSHSSSLSLRSASEAEARACVAVMTEFQVVAALVLVAFGTRPKQPKVVGNGGSRFGGGAGGQDGRQTQRARRKARLQLQLQRRWFRFRWRRRLFYKRAFLAVASLGVLRVAWALLQSNGGSESVGGGGSGGTTGNSRVPAGWSSSGGGVGGDSSIQLLSIVGKLKLVLGKGLFTS